MSSVKLEQTEDNHFRAGSRAVTGSGSGTENEAGTGKELSTGSEEGTDNTLRTDEGKTDEGKLKTENEQKTDSRCRINDKLKEVFRTPNGKAFIGFITAGDPTADNTVNCILEMERAGADLVEIGIPFSDPTAEGPVIQDANVRALKGGMTTDGAFDIVRRVREKSQVPLAFMTYANPVFHYGYDKFFAKCEELGVDAIIVPDLPYEEKREMEEPANAHNVALISMIAPTSESRIQEIASEAKGFIYVVSSMGVTGVRSEIKTDVGAIVESIRKVTDVPCAVGFGISTPEQAKRMAAVSDGAIVGSAIVKIVAQYGEDAPAKVYKYVKSMKEAVMQA